jgi:hypothetical protein
MARTQRVTFSANVTSAMTTSTMYGQQLRFTRRRQFLNMHPVVALVTAGVEMDVLGIDYDLFADVDRDAIVRQYPRTPHFKEDILQAFYDGIKHRPETTFGNVKADVLVDKDANFQRGNFCSVIRNSRWIG